MRKLRSRTEASRWTPGEVNQRYSKSANLAAIKFLLNYCEGRVFGGFKVLHTATAYEVVEGHDTGFDDWIQVASGQKSLALRRNIR